MRFSWGTDSMASVKMVLITPIFPPGGGGAAVVHYQLCKQLEREACALVPTAVDGDEARRFGSKQPFSIVRLPFLARKPTRGGPRWLRAAWNIIGKRLLPRIPLAVILMHQLRRLRPEVVCIAGLDSLYWIIPLVRWTTRAKVVFYIHGEEVSAGASLGAISQRLYNRSISAMHTADAVVTVSKWTARQILELGIAPDKVKVIYNGVDHQRFYPGPADETIQARHRLEGKRMILTVNVEHDFRSGGPANQRYNPVQAVKLTTEPASYSCSPIVGCPTGTTKGLAWCSWRQALAAGPWWEGAPAACRKQSWTAKQES